MTRSTGGAVTGTRRPSVPTLRIERQMLRSGLSAVAGCDEVGRGALSGPATVAMVVVTADSKPAPFGVRDSKLLTPQARQALVPRIRRWAAASGIGHASPAEIDQLGIIAALRLAGHRALAGLSVVPDTVLLDGNHDYLRFPDPEQLEGAVPAPRVLSEVPPVVTMIRADLRCAAVAAASVLAKTARDAIMTELAADHPHYGWDENKGYASSHHVAALRTHGPSEQHRRSWRLPGCDADPADAEVPARP
ncbi:MULTISPECIES: ribonuclease HII [Aeromicrobium]|uniref:ribonuclease HII n=1 Tax=Aeromicrobium TaxID=2040 RepID=UPI000A6C9D3C|nr:MULTISPECIES: ribonuclease HII [Aeromicrobium]MCL8250186.1 ribonuclease HII [Aeromicrobium fastidiosum]